MNRLFSFFLLLTVCLSAAHAAPKTWDNIRAIAPGHAIRVHTAAEKQTGTFIAVDETTLRLKTSAGNEVSVPRSEITRVYSQSRSHRRRNFIIGAVIGVAVGAIAYGTLGTLLENEGAEDTATLLFVPIAIGGAVGAAVPTGRMKVMYDAKQR